MSAVKTIHDANALLVFSVGPVLCCAPTLTVETVMLPPLIHKTPGSDRNHPGVFRHNNGMVSVVDLRQRFGVEEEAWLKPGRVIVAEIEGGHAGFLVDTIHDVMLWPEQGWGAVPALAPRDVFKRTLLLKNKIHLYADFEDLFRFRESGYLREHIAVLVEKQQRDTVKEQITITVPEKVTTESRHINREETERVVTIDISPAVIDSVPVPARPVTETNTSEKTVASRPGKKPEEKNRLETITRNKVTVDKIPKINITENKKTVVVDSNPIRQVDKTADNIFNVQVDRSKLLATDASESSSGKVYISGVIILLLAAMVLLMTSFREAEKVVTILEVKAVNEPSHPDGDLESKLNQDNEYQADITQDAEGIVITIDEVAEETQIPEVVSVDHSKPVGIDEFKSDAISTPVPAPVIENKNIIHIVVPGDTLWDIANRYVRDPWRYPELAKLSNIKNPHRIYPGNKVKIIIRKPNKPAQQ